MTICLPLRGIFIEIQTSEYQAGAAANSRRGVWVKVKYTPKREVLFNKKHERMIKGGLQVDNKEVYQGLKKIE